MLVLGAAGARAEGPGTPGARPEGTVADLVRRLEGANEVATREEAARRLARRYADDAGIADGEYARLAPDLLGRLRDEPDPRVRRWLHELLAHLQARGHMSRSALMPWVVPARLPAEPGAVELSRLADLYEDPHLTPHLLQALLAGLGGQDALDRQEAIAGLEAFYFRHLADVPFDGGRMLPALRERVLADPSLAVRRRAFAALSRLFARDPVRVGDAVERLIDERRGPESSRRARAAAYLGALLAPYEAGALAPSGGAVGGVSPSSRGESTVITLFRILVPPLLFVDLEGESQPDETGADAHVLAPAEADALRQRVRRVVASIRPSK